MQVESAIREKTAGGGGWEGILFLYDVRGGLAIFLTAADISEGKIARMAILAVMRHGCRFDGAP